jgi:NAD(P)H-hydrate epimerase
MFVNTTGNTGLSKGGSGDVLAGYAGGLLAQGYTLFEAAIISAYLHGKAADMLVRDGREEAEILPADILDYIGRKGYLLGTL